MPEGDSVHKLALRIRGDLVGQPLRRFFVRDRGEIGAFVGRRVTRIDVLGKHMLVHIEPDWVLRIHLGMKGRCRDFATPPPLREGVSALVQTPRRAVVWFRTMHAELTRAHDPNLRRRLKNLGPDLLADPVDYPSIAARARELGRSNPIAEVLLDQRVASGIGNVYRSEVLFLTGIYPWTPMSQLEPRFNEIFTTAAVLMAANLDPGLRTTTSLRNTGIRRPPSQSRHWVYRRADLPCFRCRSSVHYARSGDMNRSVYWCPRCQPKPD